MMKVLDEKGNINPMNYIPTGDPTHAKRFNVNKVDLSLIPIAATIAECRVWMHGEKKYGRDNWKKGWGEKTTEIACASALRHLVAILEGEDLDSESGCLHAAHVRCNMAMILEHLRSKDEI